MTKGLHTLNIRTSSILELFRYHLYASRHSVLQLVNSTNISFTIVSKLCLYVLFEYTEQFHHNSSTYQLYRLLRGQGSCGVPRE
jgi:hypothetical protein